MEKRRGLMTAAFPKRPERTLGAAAAQALCDYGRLVEQLITNVPGDPGTATAAHFAAFASAGVTTANWAATRPRSERAIAAVRLVFVMMISFGGFGGSLTLPNARVMPVRKRQ